MAYLTNLLLQVVDGNGNPRSNVGAMIAPAGDAVATSGNAAGGVYQFTGLVAGLYDVSAIVSGVNYTTRNYEIKNSFLIPVGESSVAAEGRTYVRSEDTIQDVGAGVLAQNHSNPTGTITSTGYVNEGFSLAFPTPTGTSSTLVTNFSETIGLAKQSGNSYYHGNQDTTFSQRLRISVA